MVLRVNPIPLSGCYRELDNRRAKEPDQIATHEQQHHGHLARAMGSRHHPSSCHVREQNERHVEGKKLYRNIRPPLGQQWGEFEPQTEEKILHGKTRRHRAQSQDLMIPDRAPDAEPPGDQHLSPIPDRGASSCAFLQEVAGERGIKIQKFKQPDGYRVR